MFPLSTCSVELHEEKPNRADQLTPFFEFATLDRLRANRLFRPRKNIHITGIVNVTASSVYNYYSECHQKNAVDLGTSPYYESTNGNDTWICYGFKARRVIPVCYSVVQVAVNAMR